MAQSTPTKDALLALGFEQCSGILHAPSTAATTLTPIGRFYQLAIKLPSGGGVSCVVSERALTIDHQETKP